MANSLTPPLELPGTLFQAIDELASLIGSDTDSQQDRDDAHAAHQRARTAAASIALAPGDMRQVDGKWYRRLETGKWELAAPPEALCMCKDRALSQCPGEWEPGCDLGNNPKFARGHWPYPVVDSGAGGDVTIEPMRGLPQREGDAWRPGPDAAPRPSDSPTGAPTDEPRDTFGTGYGCACQRRDPRLCAMQRYPFVGYTQPERCECLCHQWDDLDE